MNAVEIKGVTKSFGDFALQNLDLALPKGCILGLAGENGAGKSTTIKLIMNAMERDCGEITVLGVDNRSKEFTEVKEDIGVVLDEAFFPEVLTAEGVDSVMKNIYKNWDEETFWGYIERFSLPRKKIFKDYSRGMKMKLSIAAALSHGAKLLILDEATGGLDPMVRDEILDVFSDFTRDEEHSVLFSSHIVSDLEKICDYIAFIHKGRLVVFDEKDSLLSKYAVLKLPREKLAELPAEAVHGVKETPYGAEVLAEREKLPREFCFEHTSLEDIIIFLAREDAK